MRNLLVLLAIAFTALPSLADTAGPVKLPVQAFVTLPADIRHPEGLTTNPANGDLYVATFDAREPAAERNNQLLRYSAAGKLLARGTFERFMRERGKLGGQNKVPRVLSGDAADLLARVSSAVVGAA